MSPTRMEAGTRVHVDKTFFYSDANASEKFYGMIMKMITIE